VVLGQVVGIKKIELLNQTLPTLQRLAFLINGNNPSFVRSVAASRAAAQAMGMQLVEMDFRAPDQLESVLAAVRGSGAEAMSVGADGFLGAQFPHILALAASEGLPAIYSDRRAVDMGGLMSYGPSFTQSYRRAADYADRILRGAKPAALPVDQASVFEFAVNVQTARSLGISFPPCVADQVTEWVQ
jgi:putative tryptophan/tyrosine transport system substrate-binding protein